MLLHHPIQQDLASSQAVVDVEIVIPVFNEAHSIEQCLRALTSYLSSSFPFTWRVTVADNASTDATWNTVRRLERAMPGVRGTHLDQKGRGRALKATWLASSARVVAYMDVDLSTDLAALLPLVAPLLSEHSDVAIGTRLAVGSRVQRGAKREFISRCYNALLHATLATHTTDAQCGFKAMRREVAAALLPLVEDDSWFFDTELLAVAERNGFRIAEIPVDWVDDPDSRVHVASTALDDLRGVVRLLRSFSAGHGVIEGRSLGADRPTPGLATQVVPFAAIGIATTILFAVIFVLLAPRIGLVAADVVALALATFANLAGNRRLTFAFRGPTGMARHYVAGVLVGAIPLSLNLIALGIASLVSAGSLSVALLAVTVANLMATALRFVLLRRWVFVTPR